MSMLFSTTSPVALLSKQLVFVTLNVEDFTGSTATWDWNTPGFDDPGVAWSQATGATPTGSSGPNGGASSTSRAVTPGNSYAFTESSTSEGPYTLESPEFDASLGPVTLTFDVHMRFGTNGDQTDGTLQVQGWNGTAWSDVGPNIVGSQQTSPDQAYRASSEFGDYDSTGFSNTDFKFRFRFTDGVTQVSGGTFNYDCAIDNARVVGPEFAFGGGGPIETLRQIALNAGLRKIFVSKSGNDGNSGLSEGQAKLTIQGGINVLQQGDALEIDDGIYDEVLNVSNIPGTVPFPVLIAAKNPGQVFLDNLIEDARDGTRVWTDEGGGVYSSTGTRPYMGEHNGDYLQYYKSEADLRASSITAFSAIAGANRTIEKPDYGFAFEPNGGSTAPNASGTIFIRLRGGANPNGQSILLTKNFSRVMIDQNNADNVIWDGLTLRGGGNTQAINVDTACASPTFVNMDFQLCRHGVEVASATLFHNCTYRYVGFDQWSRDLFNINQENKDDNGVFVIQKGYFNGTIIGSSSGNALGEGSMERGKSSVQSNIEIRFCLIGPCFDGLRPGECNNVDIHDCVFFYCRDDAYQAEDDVNGNPSDGIDVHDNLFFNCYHDTSHQNASINGRHRHFRNLHIWDDPDFALRNNYVHKMISTPSSGDVFVYHNTYIIDYGFSTGGSLRLWADFGGPSTGNRIIDFANNLIVIPRDLSDGGGSNPQSIFNNAVVGPSAGAASFLTVNGGQFVGTTLASMGLNEDFTLAAGSQAIGIGAALQPEWTDSITDPGANDDAGFRPFGTTVGLDWPRSKLVTFSDDTPPRWTNPGAQ